ncbi:DUF1579 family protein [Rhodanobacter aciditrophus]|uniref:DUF1579 family protein n=1 Tax=Rhodanobacter aciditrophus TaxID=1623218 RepID=UPI003CE9934C
MDMKHALGLLAGEWEGEETIATTRWGEGGPARGRISARLDLGGRALLMDYREERDGQPALQAHAVFTAGPGHDEYALYWFDSYGFAPAQPAPGHWDGERLVFLRSSPRGQTRHTYALRDDAFELALESSFDGGVRWEPVMQGSYRRVA